MAGENAAVNVVMFLATLGVIAGAIALFLLIVAGITALIFDGGSWLARKGWRYSSDFPYELKEKYRI